MVKNPIGHLQVRVLFKNDLTEIWRLMWGVTAGEPEHLDLRPWDYRPSTATS
jgi:hypothetical protein